MAVHSNALGRKDDFQLLIGLDCMQCNIKVMEVDLVLSGGASVILK